mgnify:CR=1 FL=1
MREDGRHQAAGAVYEAMRRDPRVRATELLLQERIPRQRPVTEPRPLNEMLVTPPALGVPLRRYRRARG